MPGREKRGSASADRDAIEALTPRLLRGWLLPQQASAAEASIRGSLLLVAGSHARPAAPVVTATSALRVGTHSVSIATVDGIALGVGLNVPEARMIALPETSLVSISPASAEELSRVARACQCTVIGPGLSGEESLTQLLSALFPILPPTVVVLSDLSILAIRECPDELYDSHASCVLLVSPIELAALMDEPVASLMKDSASSVRRAAARFRSIVVIKGPETSMANPDGRVIKHRGGEWTTAMSSALPGVVGGLVANGADPLQASAWGVLLCVAAAERLAVRLGPVGHLTHELLAEIPPVMAELSRPVTAPSPEQARRRGRRS